MRVADRVLLGFLILDGFIVGLLSVGFVYLRLGETPVPVAAIAAGLLNCLLLWLAAKYTDGPLRYGPLVAWLIVLAVAGMGGPGGDVMLALQGSTTLATLLLVIIGLGAPVALVWSRRLPEAEA